MKRNHNQVAQCLLCENEAHYRQSGLCKACYSAIWYWQGKTPTQLAKRGAQLAKFKRRLELLSSAKRPRGGARPRMR